MIDFLKRLIRRYGFFRRTVQIGFLPGSDNWIEAQFFTEEKRRNERLAEIARERAWVYANKDDLLRTRKGFYVRLRALTNEELALERGKPEARQ